MFESPASKNVSNGRIAMLRFAFVAFAALVMAAPAVATPTEAHAWLERLAKASRERNYEGTFVYRHQGNLEALRIIHRADSSGDRERLYSLTGTPREIIRDDQKVTCILPDDQAVMVDRRLLSNPLSGFVSRDVNSIAKNYRLSMLADERIAGRQAKLVDIAPTDPFRYGYRLWIDSESGLLLRADLFNEKGKRVEQLMFTELRTPESIPTSALEPEISGEGFTWYQSEPQAKAQSPEGLRWDIEGIPAGFELVLHEVRTLPGNDRPVEHLLYSDGLASVSVYIETARNGDGFSGHSRMGALNAYGLSIDGVQAAVVGEVPAATVMQIGKSIRAKSAQSAQ